MTPETLTALQGSIAKWEAIVAGKGVDDGGDNCPLCKLFIENDHCAGCPIASHSGAAGCCNTPYDQWYRLHRPFNSVPLKAETPEQFDAAQAELDFLRSLLPVWQWGFDTTKFKPDGWRNVVGDLRLRFHSRVKLHLCEFQWQSMDSSGEFDTRLSVFTTANPHTGEYYHPNQRPQLELDFAGFIGIEGDPVYVRRAIEAIKLNAEYIKGETPHKRSFI